MISYLILRVESRDQKLMVNILQFSSDSPFDSGSGSRKENGPQYRIKCSDHFEQFECAKAIRVWEFFALWGSDVQINTP